MELKLIKWLAENAIPEVKIINNNIDFYWCLRKDAANAWDYIDDDRLKWYTSEEIHKLYQGIEFIEDEDSKSLNLTENNKN